MGKYKLIITSIYPFNIFYKKLNHAIIFDLSHVACSIFCFTENWVSYMRIQISSTHFLPSKKTLLWEKFYHKISGQKNGITADFPVLMIPFIPTNRYFPRAVTPLKFRFGILQFLIPIPKEFHQIDPVCTL